VFLEGLLKPLLKKLPDQITIEELHPSRTFTAKVLQSDDSVPGSAPQIPKLKLIKAFNTVCVSESLASGVFESCELHTFIYLMSLFEDLEDPYIYRDLPEQLRKSTYSNLAQIRPKLEHYGFHIQSDGSDKTIIERRKVPEPTTRRERKQARQSVGYEIGKLTSGCEPLNHMRTISVSIGLYSEVPEQELINLSYMCPQLTDLGLSHSLSTAAVQEDMLDIDARKDAEEQAVRTCILLPTLDSKR
jgi:hypothetical protein